MELKSLGKVTFTIAVALSLVLSIFYIYIHFFVDDFTIGINNINDQIALDIVNAEELSDAERNEYEERWFIEANYYNNSKDNGIALQELRYNYFTSYRLQQVDYRSTGMQYLGEYESSTISVSNKNEADAVVRNEFYYYDTTNGISWSGYRGQYGSIGTKLNRNEVMIIKIDNKPYGIQLTGKKDIYEKFLFWNTKTKTIYYDYGDVFDCVMYAIKSSSALYGDYYITVDLSDYFTIYEYDTTTGKYKDDDVTDIIKNYAVVKVHYDANGAINAKQSIFGNIACNPNYGLSTAEYWQSRIVYNLTDNALTYRYSEVYQGYLVSLSINSISLLNNTEHCDICVVLDINSDYLTSNNINIIGLDYDAFAGVQIESLTIKSNQPITMLLLERCLYNTNIKQIIHNNLVTLDISDTAINNTYEEVVV